MPEARPGDVRLAGARGASLNFPDVLMCRGEYQVKPPLPFTPGAEVAGVVDAVGEGVDGLADRRPRARDPELRRGRVRGVTTASAGRRVPDSRRRCRSRPASALHVVYQTGHLALHRRAHLQPGETLLVHAGAGGVGSAAIQLGLAAGARVDRDRGRSREGGGVPQARRATSRSTTASTTSSTR